MFLFTRENDTISELNILLLLIAFHLRGQYVSRKVNEISLTRSKWKIACVYEIKAIMNYISVTGNENVENRISANCCLRDGI